MLSDASSVRVRLKDLGGLLSTLRKMKAECQESSVSAALEDGMQQTTLAVKDGKAVLEPRSVSSFPSHIAAFVGCAWGRRIREGATCAARKA